MYFQAGRNSHVPDTYNFLIKIWYLTKKKNENVIPSEPRNRKRERKEKTRKGQSRKMRLNSEQICMWEQSHRTRPLSRACENFRNFSPSRVKIDPKIRRGKFRPSPRPDFPPFRKIRSASRSRGHVFMKFRATTSFSVWHVTCTRRKYF